MSAWKGYGWIEPASSVSHPAVDKHRGRIYCHQVDVQGEVKILPFGTEAEFFLYEDEAGLGAEEVADRAVLARFACLCVSDLH